MVDPRYVYEDLLTMPDDGNRYEILEGNLLVSPSPSWRHQRVVTNVVMTLSVLQARGLGQVCPAPMDVVLTAHTALQPDVLFIRTDRLDIVTERSVNGPPDLVVEVLSESTRSADLGRKLRAYARYGVPEYWVLDPDAHTIEVFRQRGVSLENLGAVGLHGKITFLGTVFQVRDLLA